MNAVTSIASLPFSQIQLLKWIEVYPLGLNHKLT